MEKPIQLIQAGIDESAIRKDVSRISAIHACAEYVDNQFDAGSLQGEIFTDRPVNPEVVYFLDCGSGMSMSSIKAFFTFGRSEWQTRKHKGRNGKGSKFMLYHAEKIVVRTRSAGDQHVKTFTIDLENWLNQILKGREVEIKTDSLVGEHELDPETGTFTLFIIYPRQEKRSFFSEDYLIENLGELLSPQYADRVFINGKTLKPRDIIGGFEFETSDPTLGDIRAFIYQPIKVKSRDVLRIGSIGPVMDFRPFTDGLPKDLRERIPFTFFDRSICGLIEVEAFNQWREGASREFRYELYESDEIELFVDFLESILGPKIADEFGLHATAIEDKERKNFETLRRLSEDAYGKIQLTPKSKKPKKTRERNFRIAPWTLTIAPGESQTFKVKGRLDEEFSWDCSKIPGASLNIISDREVILSIDSKAKFNPNDQYHLRVTQHSTGKTKVAYIKISPDQEMCIIPRAGSYYVGDRINLRATNVPNTVKNLHWEIDPTTVGKLTRDSGFSNIELIVTNAGKCVITASDTNNHAIRSKAVIYFYDRPIDKVDVAPDGPMMKIENMIILIKTYNSAFQQQAILERVNDNCLTFHLNIEHPKYHNTMNTSESAWREYILQLIVTYYVLWKSELEKMNRDQIQENISDIMAKLA